MNPERPAGIVTFLFTDIEGSTRLWEQRARADAAGARAPRRARARGRRGPPRHGRQDDRRRHPRRVRRSARRGRTRRCELQQALADPAADRRASRCACAAGCTLGVVERRDNDFFGSAVNRAARIMSAAHGGQVLLSQAVAALVARPPARRRHAARPRRRAAARPREPRAASTRSCIRGCAQDFPALRSLEATPNNLPQQVTSFIGRERELAEVEALLATTRLLTLLGVGGLGKTRLSLQVAADVLDDYPGRRLVRRARAAVRSAARAAGGRRRCWASRRRRAARSSRRWSRYVQGPAPAARSSTTASTCCRPAPSWRSSCCSAAPQLKILATSREPLRVAGRDDLSGARRCAVPGLARRRSPRTALRAVRGGAAVRRARGRPRSPAFARDARRTPPRWPTSAAGSTASRSRSSWPRRACARCRSSRSPRASTTASGC